MLSVLVMEVKLSYGRMMLLILKEVFLLKVGLQKGMAVLLKYLARTIWISMAVLMLPPQTEMQEQSY